MNATPEICILFTVSIAMHGCGIFLRPGFISLPLQQRPQLILVYTHATRLYDATRATLSTCVLAQSCLVTSHDSRSFAAYD